VSSIKFLGQFSPPPFDGFQASLDLSSFLVEIGQLLLELLLLQPIFTALFLDEGFDFVPQKPKPRLACILFCWNCSLPARMAPKISS
jgi:hypothetical protein